ncbi:MAG: transposase [Verrucomicrobiota bacterium]
METATETTEIVDDGRQRDRRGRVNWPRERREQLLAEYERSGLSQAAFARREGVRYPTFAHWVQQRRRGALTTPGRERVVVPRFMEVGVPATPSSPELSVSLPGGLVARGVDAAALATLVRALLVRA